MAEDDDIGFEEGDMETLFSKKHHKSETPQIDFDPLTAEKPQGADNPELNYVVSSKYEFTIDNTITPAVARTKPGLGLSFQLWPAALHLCRYLENNMEYLNPSKYGVNDSTSPITVVEVGAGTGIVGIVSAKLCSRSRVYITDLQSVMENIQRNIEANEIPYNNVLAKPLCWGETLDAEFAAADLILASDVVYTESLFDLLIDSLLQLFVKPTTTMLMSYERRRKIENRFWKRLNKHFHSEVVQTIDVPSARHKKIEIILIRRK